jgi:hypothetical protein
MKAGIGDGLSSSSSSVNIREVYRLAPEDVTINRLPDEAKEPVSKFLLRRLQVSLSTAIDYEISFDLVRVGSKTAFTSGYSSGVTISPDSILFMSCSFSLT